MDEVTQYWKVTLPRRTSSPKYTVLCVTNCRQKPCFIDIEFTECTWRCTYSTDTAVRVSHIQNTITLTITQALANRLLLLLIPSLRVIDTSKMCNIQKEKIVSYLLYSCNFMNILTWKKIKSIFCSCMWNSTVQGPLKLRGSDDSDSQIILNITGKYR